MPDGYQGTVEVPREEERSYKFVSGNPSVATMSSIISICFIHVLHLWINFSFRSFLMSGSFPLYAFEAFRGTWWIAWFGCLRLRDVFSILVIFHKEWISSASVGSRRSFSPFGLHLDDLYIPSRGEWRFCSRKNSFKGLVLRRTTQVQDFRAIFQS